MLQEDKTAIFAFLFTGGVSLTLLLLGHQEGAVIFFFLMIAQVVVIKTSGLY